jgi:prepilin-type processing-associated H-X9-DG protein
MGAGADFSEANIEAYEPYFYFYKVHNPSVKIVGGDSAGATYPSLNHYWSFQTPDNLWTGSGEGYGNFLMAHGKNKMVNVLYCDGHVKAIRGNPAWWDNASGPYDPGSFKPSSTQAPKYSGN